jgi:signal transduction histidine kinase
MNLPSTPTPIMLTAQSPDEADTRLRGRWLLLARIVWIITAVLALGLYVASVPTYVAFLHVLCTDTHETCWNNGQITPHDLQAFQAWGLSLDFFVAYNVTFYVFFIVFYAITGIVIFWYKSDDRMALFASFLLLTFPSALNKNFLLTLPSVLLLPDLFLAFIGSSSFSLFFYLFPTGRFVPRWTRWLSLGLIGLWAVRVSFPSLHVRTSILFLLAHLGFVCSALVAQIYRYRRMSSTIQQQQTKWVVFGISINIVSYLVLHTLWMFFFLSSVEPSAFAILLLDAAIYLCFLIIPLSIGMAILRYRLFDIDLIINRTLLYGALSLSVIGLYILVVMGLGASFQAQGNPLISLLATGLIALLFQPLRNRLQQGINRMMYGERDDPYRIISRLGERLEATVVPDALLPTIVETVALALKLPYAAIELKDGEQLRLAASYGVNTHPSLHIPLLYQQETIGYLMLASRSPGESFTRADQRLLEDLARQAGIAAHTVRLTADLQQSRERLLLAREEERRRLARELHDSVSQALYGISLGAHAAQMALQRHPDQVSEPLNYVLSLAEVALAEMRALIFELRPESLETEGLVSALTKQTAALRARHQITIVTDQCDEPDLPLQVKQELYRIAQEAMHNTVKHAQASQIVLRLEETADGVLLEVCDNGIGFDTMGSFPGHLGLHSMRERVTNLGGNIEIESASGTGTRICVHLPDKDTMNAEPLV